VRSIVPNWDYVVTRATGSTRQLAVAATLSSGHGYDKLDRRYPSCVLHRAVPSTTM
jgi:hypothetical protein